MGICIGDHADIYRASYRAIYVDNYRAFLVYQYCVFKALKLHIKLQVEF
jgi:hypothetical protein